MRSSSPATSARWPRVVAAPIAPIAFVLVAVTLQFASFGDPNRGADETFYFLAGQRMHDGLLPYVDIWDRKPFGLFAFFYLIAGVSTSVLSYQLAACLCNAATAVVIHLTVQRLAGWRGGLTAGLSYLLLLDPFDGNVGQSSDFYNLLIASAACLILRDQGRIAPRPGWPIWAAMALCGVAITVKQTALFESLFFGLWIVASLTRAKLPSRQIAAVAAICMGIGALPTLIVAGFYWQIGHWPEFWQAIVLSNLAKGAVGGEARQLFGIAVRAAPLAAFAAWGIRSSSIDPLARRFLTGWIFAALIGFIAVPNFYGHYFLPVLVPLSVAAGLLFGRHARGTLLFASIAAFAVLWTTLPDRGMTNASISAMGKASTLIRNHDPGGGLLIYDGSHYLYALTGERFLSPLVFPQHLNHSVERNVSHLDTHAEIDRIIAARPGVVVLTRFPTYLPIDRYGRGRVIGYIRDHCRLVGKVPMTGQPPDNPHLIFGDCGSIRR